MIGAGDELGGGVQAVHVRHLGRGHARRGRQAAERVAGAHLVGAHRLGRALRGAGAAAWATGALPGAGSLSVVPWMTQRVGLQPVGGRERAQADALAAAIALSVSPGCTR